MQDQSLNLLPPLDLSNFLDHFQNLMGPYGLYEHATIKTPLLNEGYCTDDNARAIIMLLYLRDLGFSDSENDLIDDLVDRCWKFIIEAQEKPGIFFNLRTSDGVWLSQDRSEDMYARLIRTMVVILEKDKNPSRQLEAKKALASLLQTVEHFTAPRAWAEILVALGDLSPEHHSEFNVSHYIEKGTRILLELWAKNSSSTWPWFEEVVTYANALLPHGLLSSIKLFPNKEVEDILHTSLDFLFSATIKDGVFAPIGSRGWYPKGGIASHDNQQAIEAGTSFDLLLDYRNMFPEKDITPHIKAVYGWFFGKNTGNIVLVDTTSGSCLDGLFLTGPNPNNGAESMLAYQWVEILARLSPSSLQKSLKETLD